MNKFEKGPGPILWIPVASYVEVEHFGNDNICSSNFCSSPLCSKYMIASEMFSAKGELLDRKHLKDTGKKTTEDGNGNSSVEHTNKEKKR